MPNANASKLAATVSIDQPVQLEASPMPVSCTGAERNAATLVAWAHCLVSPNSYIG